MTILKPNKMTVPPLKGMKRRGDWKCQQCCKVIDGDRAVELAEANGCPKCGGKTFGLNPNRGDYYPKKREAKP
jgi:hypothetical protein